MAKEESMKKVLIIGAGILLIDCILLGIGGWCLAPVEMLHSTTLEREYMRVNVCIDVDLINLYCTAFRPSEQPFLSKCECDFGLTVEEDIKGAVTLYYELEDFDQTNSSYASSKDDQQLLGTPGERPAEACGNYSYNGDLPIFPCGEIADSMFNDTFTLMKGDEIVPVEYTGLLAGDISNFHNPSPEVLKNFSSPINWSKSGRRPWEANTELKGIENPAFRAWMDTSLKRKPVWRLQRKGRYSDGLPAGNYSLVIMMHYGVDRYDGPRTIILEGVYAVFVTRNLGWGVVLVLLAVTLLALGAGYVFKLWNRSDANKRTNDETERTLRGSQ